MGHCRLILGFVLCLGALPGVLMAQVTMEATLGLQGTIRLEKWNVVTVRLHNAGPPLQATLGVRVWRGSELRDDLHRTSYTRAVELPSRARKRFTFTVPITSTAYPVEVFLQTDTATPLLQQQLNLREALTTEQLILGLTHDLSLDFLATVFQTHTRVVYLAPQELPPYWQGYDSVSAIVVKGISLQSLSEAQMTALRQWLARGGTMVVAGDPQYALLQEPRLGELLPVQVLGLQQFEALPAFATHYGVALPDASLLTVQAHLTRGRVLVGTPDAPLLAERSFGAGRVVFLALDYAVRPFVSWAGNTALWKEILQPTDTVDFSRVFAELGLLDETHPIMRLLKRPILTYPSHLALSLFLIAYCSSLGVLFWWMRRGSRRRWLGWGCVVICMLGFFVWAYMGYAAYGLRQAGLVFDLSTIEILPETGYGRVHGYLGLFAASGGSFTLPLRQPNTLLRHTFTRGAGRAGQAFEVTTDGPPMIRQIVLEPWALRLFSVESMIPAPVHTTANRHVSGLTVQVENRSTLPLQGTIVIYQGVLFPLGSLAPGAAILDDLYPRLQTDSDRAEQVWQALFKQRPLATDVRLAYQQEVLLRHFFGDEYLAAINDTPLLTGWILTPTTVQSQSGPTVWGATLVVNRLTLSNL